jgi:hypothetical protein
LALFLPLPSIASSCFYLPPLPISEAIELAKLAALLPEIFVEIPSSLSNASNFTASSTTLSHQKTKDFHLYRRQSISWSFCIMQLLRQPQSRLWEGRLTLFHLPRLLRRLQPHSHHLTASQWYLYAMLFSPLCIIILTSLPAFGFAVVLFLVVVSRLDFDLELTFPPSAGKRVISTQVQPRHQHLPSLGQTLTIHQHPSLPPRSPINLTGTITSTFSHFFPIRSSPSPEVSTSSRSWRVC